MSSEPRTPEGMDLFEVYEASGALLVVTSDAIAAREAMEPGDSIVRRPWATTAPAITLPPVRPVRDAGEEAGRG